MKKNFEDFIKIGKLYQFKKAKLYANNNLSFDRLESSDYSPSYSHIKYEDIVLILTLKIDCTRSYKDYTLQVSLKNEILERSFSETSFLESMIFDTFNLLS